MTVDCRVHTTLRVLLTLAEGLVEEREMTVDCRVHTTLRVLLTLAEGLVEEREMTVDCRVHTTLRVLLTLAEGLVEEREMALDCRIRTTLRALVLPRWRPFPRTADNPDLRMKETQPEGDIAQEDTVANLKSHTELLQWT